MYTCFFFVVNISIDLYVGYWGIESDVRWGRGHKIFLLHVVILFIREKFIGDV
jgi:hypothetical protein